MLDRMQQNLEGIKERGSKNDDYLRHMFRAMMTCTNVIFRDFIQKGKENWETEGTTTSENFGNFPWNKFNNIVATTKWSKHYPKYSVIAALTTRVNNLEDGKYHGRGVNPTKTTTPNPSGQGISGDAPSCPGLEKWRIVKGGVKYH